MAVHWIRTVGASKGVSWRKLKIPDNFPLGYIPELMMVMIVVLVQALALVVIRILPIVL